MRHLRKSRGWTAARLADEMSAQGVPWRREVVTKLETGHTARAITVDELLALAVVFGVTPNELLFPVEPGEVQLTASRSAGFVEAWSWARGQRPLGSDWSFTAQAVEFTERNHPDLYPESAYEDPMPTDQFLNLVAAHKAFLKILRELRFPDEEPRP